VKVKDDPRACVSGRLESPPAQRRGGVVGVDDPCSRFGYGLRDLFGVQAAREQTGRGLFLAEARRVPLQHFDVLVEVFADQPPEVLDRSLLAAHVAVAVVEEEDHAAQRLVAVAASG
jgi:hypothetical protein